MQTFHCWQQVQIRMCRVEKPVRAGAHDVAGPGGVAAVPQHDSPVCQVVTDLPGGAAEPHTN